MSLLLPGAGGGGGGGSAPTPTGYIVIESVTDLPEAVAGVITIPADAAYLFSGIIDLNGAYMVMAGICAITGTSSETASIKSTGLTGAMIRSSYSLPMRNIAFVDLTGAASVFELDGTGSSDAALDWSAVNFLNCTVGPVTEYTNFISMDGAWLESDGLVLDGEFGTVEISGSLVNSRAGNTAISFASTCVITRRFRASKTAFVALAGETAINVDDKAVTFANTESFVLLNASFAGGGTYLDGIAATDNAALIHDTIGVTNSSDIAHLYALGNATATDNSAAGSGVYVKVAGATSDGASVAKFTQADNRAEYHGALESYFHVSATFTGSAGSNHELGFLIYVNGVAVPDSLATITANAGGRAESGGCHTIALLTDGDYVELWCANINNATDITVEDFSLIITVAS